MAKKIEVWAHLHSYRGEWFVDERPHETKVGGTQKASTLVVHDDKHERVFTESEVRAILNTFINHLRDGCSVMSGDVRAVARYHGITLDPA